MKIIEEWIERVNDKKFAIKKKERSMPVRIPTWSAFLFIVLMPSMAWAQPCKDLVSFSLPDVTIDAAELVAAGAFVPPGESAGMLRGISLYLSSVV